tara:strand:- start:11 stop:250 length:240 start_codon:yes stop_codon:yes gene_type:complete
MKKEKTITIYKLSNKVMRIFRIDDMYLTDKGIIKVQEYVELVLYNTTDKHQCNITGLMVADAFLKAVRNEMSDIFKEVA